MAQDAAVARPVHGRHRYEDDYYGWLGQQVALLASGRLSEVDAQNIAEELTDVATSEYRSLRSAIAVLSQHLLKWDHQPERRSRSWVLTVREQRWQITGILGESPSLQARLDEAVADGYRFGRSRALSRRSSPARRCQKTVPIRGRT